MSPDVHTLTGAYALDALHADERGDFERHIADCPECAREVSELRATAARLGSAIARPAPDRLRASVFAEIGRTRQDPPSGPRLVGSSGSDDRRCRWLVWSASLVAAFALLATGIVAGVAVNEGSALRSAQSRLSQAQAQFGQVGQLLAAPDVRTSTDSVDGGSATMVASRSLGRSVLITQNMPVGPADRAYQAWGISAAGVYSLGLLGNGGSASVTTDLVAATTIGITIEPAGGSAQPTSVPIMTFPVPA